MSLEGKSVEEIQALAELADGLSRDPKTREGFLRLTKTVNPSASIPEIDIPAGLQAQMKPYIEQLDALTRKQAERDMKDSIEARRRELRGKGLKDTEIEQVEKVMVERKIADHATAAEFVRMQSKAAEPTPATTQFGARKFETPKLPDLKAFNGDQKAYSYQAAYDVIDELRGRKTAA